MSEPEGRVVEHHFREPTQAQVHKAVYQYLTDQGVTTAELQKAVERKIAEAVSAKVDALLRGGTFDKMLIAAVANLIQSERKAFENNTYGWHNHIRDLVRAELQRLILSEYKVSVTKIEEPRL